MFENNVSNGYWKGCFMYFCEILLLNCSIPLKICLGNIFVIESRILKSLIVLFIFSITAVIIYFGILMLVNTYFGGFDLWCYIINVSCIFRQFKYDINLGIFWLLVAGSRFSVFFSSSICEFLNVIILLTFIWVVVFQSPFSHLVFCPGSLIYL